MTSQQHPILVTGATGKVGRHVVSQLLDMSVPVRALVRDPAAARLPEGVDLVQGDLTQPATLEAGLDGVEAVFLLWPLLTAEAAPAVLEAVERHVRRIVYLSAMSVRDDRRQQDSPITAFHAEIERLIEQTGLEWTFLRSGAVATNTLGWAPQIRAEGVVRDVFGNAARPLIHEADIAAVAARTLTEEGHGGARYLLTGPRSLTKIEQVQAIGEAIGRPLRFEEIPIEAGRRQMLDQGWPAALVEGILKGPTMPEPVTPTVEEITGRPARTFQQWAIDHAGDFR